LNQLRKQATHHVEDMPVPQRLSDYAIGIFEKIPSRKGIKKAIKKGLIYIDHRVGNTGDWIRGGEEIVLYQDQSKYKTLFYDIEVLYEDDQMAAVYKPAEMLVNGNHHFTLERALPHNLTQSERVDAFDHPLPVHRLDFETAGIVLVAKTRLAFAHLQGQFNNKMIKKKYLAICCGLMDKDGIMSLPIEDKKAVTRFELMDTIDSHKYGRLSLAAFYPITGRTHQIRIHTASIGCPILGDKLYANLESPAYHKCHMLLAQSISCTDTYGRAISISIRPPKRMIRFFPILTLFD